MLLLLSFLFLLIFGITMACVGFGLSYFKTVQKNQIRAMLRKAQASPAEQKSQLLRITEEASFLNTFLRRYRFMRRLDILLEQSGQNSTSTKLISLCCLTFGIGLILGWKLRLFDTTLSAIPVGLLTGLLPFLNVLRKRSKAIAAFEEQLPDALDFLSRSMRAGHGFSVAMEMLATETPDPLGGAFRRVSSDVALGSSLGVAMTRLTNQVPIVDVRFFVSSVLLQQETGGNLGEILSKLAEIIRERFRLRGTVRAAAAHGKVTGMVLVLMPVAVTAFLLLTNPGYLGDMMKVPLGRLMVYGACGGQIIGYFVIKKITNIKV